jgi:hypothetical protein
MNLSRALSLLFFLCLACSAQTIQGNVQNGTTGKPEPGCQVKLFTASGELGSATTNDNGTFRIELSGHLAPRSLAILKVVHDGVEYFQAVSLELVTNIRVYDSSSDVSGISGYLSVLQFQAKGKLLQVTELHAFNNDSSPPVTRVSPDNLVLSIPEGARVQPATISGPDGGKLRLPLVPIPGQTSKYRIDFALKPGLTKYAINYQVPYDGKLVFRRRTKFPMKRIGVIVPDSMHFQSIGAKLFHPTAGQPGTLEQVLDGIGANESFAFELSGAGVLSQYFQPLNPGEPSMAAKSRALGLPSPHGGPLGTSASPARARSRFVGNQMILATGIFVLVGILLWGLMLKRAPRM